MNFRIEGFDETPIPLQFLEENKDIPIKLKHSDNSRYLHIYAHFDCTRAACDLIFYSKTTILNTSSLQFEFYAVQGDKARIIPYNHHDSNLVMASEVKEVLIAVSTNIKSRPFLVEEGGLNGKLTLRNKVSGEETDLYYETNLSVVDFGKKLMTKVLTIAPLFIIVNETK